MGTKCINSVLTPDLDFQILAQNVSTYGWVPVFDICHFPILCIDDRSDAQRAKKEKERKEKEMEKAGYTDEQLEESYHTRSLVP